MIRVSIFRKAKKSGTGGGIGTPSGNIGGQSSSARRASYAEEAGHAATSDKATVAQNLAQNSTDWVVIDEKDAEAAADAKAYADRNFLSKVAADIAQGFITFVEGIRSKAVSFFEKGIHFGEYTPGALGTGGAILIDQTGNSTAEFDYITIRKAATFRELTIKELRHVGGEIVLSAAAMKCSKVEPLDPNMQPIAADSPMVACYKCYFNTDDAEGNQQVFQEFVQGDLARCQTFSSSAGGNSGYTTTRYYWRKVLAVGEDYIILGNGSDDKDVDCTSAPAVGDNIVQLGYVGDNKPYRQSAIILSATDTDAPSMKFYQGINTFALPTPVKDEGYDTSTGLFHTKTYGESYVGNSDTYIKFTPDNGVEIKGKVEMSNASTLDGVRLVTSIANAQAIANNAKSAASAAQTAADDAQDTADLAQAAANNANTAINNLSTGNENLVVNGGFTGLYQSDSVEDNTIVNANTQIFSNPWGRWESHTGCTIVTSPASATGVACQMSSGTLTQKISRGITSGKPYTLSLLGLETGTITVSIGGFSKTITLATGVRKVEKFIASSANATLEITGTGTISEIQLIQGNVTINDWTPSPEDNNKYLSYYKNFAYLMAAIEQADTSILGGLVLTQQIRVGNYANHVMTQETGGMNGDRETDDSPFLWGGGSMTQALYTITAYANNPTFEPSQSELANMAKFVVTHGGRAILTNIIARGIILATAGIFRNISTPNGNFSIDALGNMACKDAKIGGNFYVRMTKITSANFDSYSTTFTYTRFSQQVTITILDLSKTGLNIHLNSLPAAAASAIYLPNDAAYEGALCRIYNQIEGTAYTGVFVNGVMKYVQNSHDGSVSIQRGVQLLGLGGYLVLQAVLATDGFVDWIIAGGNPTQIFPQSGNP